MRSPLFKKLVLSLVLGTVLPTMTFAATPTAYLERSTVIETGKQIRAYNVPTRDANGDIHYYDITITIPILSTGQPGTSATITSVPSPDVNTTVFAPGTYKSDGITCTLVVAPFSGRTEGIFSCINGSITLSAVWYTGALAGHPFNTELTDAGINTVPGYTNFAWGKVGGTDGFSWWNSCIHYTDVNAILAVRQVNNTLTLYNYDTDSISNCQINFTKTTP